MGKEEIKSLLENSKKVLDQNFENFEQQVKDDLTNSKKNTIKKI